MDILIKMKSVIFRLNDAEEFIIGIEGEKGNDAFLTIFFLFTSGKICDDMAK